MSNVARRCAAVFFVLSPWLAMAGVGAGEGLKITVVNRTPMEIVELSAVVETGDGRQTTTVAAGIVPGNEFVLGFGRPGRATAIALDLGLARLEFKELGAFADINPLALSAGFDDDDLEKPFLEAKAAGAEPVRVAGTASWPYLELAGKADENTPALAALFDADTMDAIRELAHGRVLEGGKIRRLAVRTGDVVWLARVDPEEGGGRFGGADEATTSVGAMVFRTEMGDEALKGAFRFLAGIGYRPWFLQRQAGAGMETAETVKFAGHANQTAEDAFLAAAETYAERRPEGEGDPGALDCLFVHPDDFAKAAAGEKPEDAAGLKLRATNGGMLELRYYPNAAAMMLLTR